MSQRKRPDFRLRECSYPTCTGYARTTCQAWDQDLDDVCGQPLCDRHAAVRGQFRFCLIHRGGPQKANDQEPRKPQPVQGGLFDPPEY